MCGQVVSEIGDWLNNIAVLALVSDGERGREGLAIALYAIARICRCFIWPAGGRDCGSRGPRRIMICADVARAVLALGFLLASRFSSLPLLLRGRAG